MSFFTGMELFEGEAADNLNIPYIRAIQKAMDGKSRNLSAIIPGAGFTTLVYIAIETR